MKFFLMLFLVVFCTVSFGMTWKELEVKLANKEYNTYQEFKVDAMKDVDFSTFSALITYSKKFEKWNKDLNNDPELEFEAKFIMTKGVRSGKLPNDAKWVLDNSCRYIQYIVTRRPKNTEYLGNAISYLEGHMIEYDQADLLKVLKKINMLIYPKISDDEYKKLATKVQLMIKTLE